MGEVYEVLSEIDPTPTDKLNTYVSYVVMELGSMHWGQNKNGGQIADNSFISMNENGFQFGRSLVLCFKLTNT